MYNVDSQIRQARTAVQNAQTNLQSQGDPGTAVPDLLAAVEALTEAVTRISQQLAASSRPHRGGGGAIV